MSPNTSYRYQKYREEEAKRLQEKEERKRVRAEKLARGEEVGPEERDEGVWSLWDIIKTLIVIIGGIALTGQLVTGSLMWGAKGRITDVRSWWPVSLACLLGLETPFTNKQNSLIRRCSARISWPSLMGLILRGVFTLQYVSSVFVVGTNHSLCVARLTVMFTT